MREKRARKGKEKRDSKKCEEMRKEGKRRNTLIICAGISGA
jgi:hypothetical protein